MTLAAYLIARLKEPSAWRGLVLLLTSLGLGISPEQSDAIVAAGLAVAGAIGAFAPDASGIAENRPRRKPVAGRSRSGQG
ncbi:MAG: hypothetical protein L0210_06960 [Rhodospirillales bacterium]|nr:hypothetical protein [Rhodospirillales bacterium]